MSSLAKSSPALTHLVQRVRVCDFSVKCLDSAFQDTNLSPPSEMLVSPE